jgi:hypothetical protein
MGVFRQRDSGRILNRRRFCLTIASCRSGRDHGEVDNVWHLSEHEEQIQDVKSDRWGDEVHETKLWVILRNVRLVFIGQSGGQLLLDEWDEVFSGVLSSPRGKSAFLPKARINNDASTTNQ